MFRQVIKTPRDEWPCVRGLDETANDVLLINKQMNTSVAGDGQVPGHVRSCRIVSARGTCAVQVGPLSDSYS